MFRLLISVFILIFYVYIGYISVTYVNDINKIDECSALAPVYGNIIWSFGIFRLSILSTTLLFSIFATLFILFIKK